MKICADQRFWNQSIHRETKGGISLEDWLQDIASRHTPSVHAVSFCFRGALSDVGKLAATY